MLGKTYDSQVCSIARTLEVVGERWSLLIIRNALFAGSTRFGDFQESLGIAPNILKARLDGFVAAGVMERRPHGEQPGLHEYVLTDKGRDLAPALVALTAWGDRWAAPDGPPILYHHAGCGERLRHEVSCPTHGHVDDAREIEARFGPGMPPERIKAVQERRARRAGSRRAAVS